VFIIVLFAAFQISNKNWVKRQRRHYQIVAILRYMTIYAN